MEREIERREREAADKTRLQLRVEQLEKEAATALLQLARPATTQRDSATLAATGALQSAQGDIHTLMTSAESHAPASLPLATDSAGLSIAGTFVQLTAATRDAHLLALSAPTPADTEHTAPPSMTDYALPPMMPDMTVATGPPRVPPRTPALTTYSSMYTVDDDRALPRVDSSQFSMMIADRRDLSMPLYTAPSAVSAFTSVVPTAVHTSSLLSDGAYVSQAPAGAFITHTSRLPAVAFPISACPGWGNAAIPMGHPNPASALPTSVTGGPAASAVDPASALFGTLLTVSSLPLLIDTTSTTTTAVTNSAVDSVSSKLAPGLEFLALASRPPGVAIYPDGQALPVPAATTSAVQPPTVTTPAAAQ